MSYFVKNIENNLNTIELLIKQLEKKMHKI